MPNDSLEANDEVKRMKMFKWITLNNWPIRYKLIMHFLLISILPAICLGILIALATDRIIEKQVNEHTSQ
jgi:two-component system sensor histidine kinase YesM